jgi:hypothetical protein
MRAADGVAGRVDGDVSEPIAFRSSENDTPREDGQAPTLAGDAKNAAMVATFVKRRGAGAGDASPESWGESDVSRTVTAADAGRQDSPPALVGTLRAAPIKGGSAGDDANALAVARATIPIAGDAARDGAALTPSADAGGRVRLRDPGLGVGGDGDPSYQVNASGPPSVFATGGGDVGSCSVDPLPDGRRYAACGDGVAAPQAHWIALRLRAVMEGRDPEVVEVVDAGAPAGGGPARAVALRGRVGGNSPELSEEAPSLRASSGGSSRAFVLEGNEKLPPEVREAVESWTEGSDDA